MNTVRNPNPYRTFDRLFRRFQYPAGESHLELKVLDDLQDLVIEAHVRNFDGLTQIVTANRVLRHVGHRGRIEWFLPYFPFARHDRRNHLGDGFELGLALELVRELDVLIVDPHSDVAGQLPHIPQSTVVEVFAEAGAFEDDPIVIIPDLGAGKKVGIWIGKREWVQARKTRDPATGKLSGFAVDATDLGGRPAIIMDDICDGGGTFLGLATELAKANAGPLRLAVTHGLFTKGTDLLLQHFDQIYTFAPSDAPDANDGVVRIPFKTLHEKGTRI